MNACHGELLAPVIWETPGSTFLPWRLMSQRLVSLDFLNVCSSHIIAWLSLFPKLLEAKPTLNGTCCLWRGKTDFDRQGGEGRWACNRICEISATHWFCLVAPKGVRSHDLNKSHAFLQTNGTHCSRICLPAFSPHVQNCGTARGLVCLQCRDSHPGASVMRHTGGGADSFLASPGHILYLLQNDLWGSESFIRLKSSVTVWQAGVEIWRLGTRPPTLLGLLHAAVSSVSGIQGSGKWGSLRNDVNSSLLMNLGNRGQVCPGKMLHHLWYFSVTLVLRVPARPALFLQFAEANLYQFP